VGFLGAAILITRFVLHGDTVRIDVIGFLCAGLNIVMYSSPLAAMVRNSVLHLLRLLLCHGFLYNFFFLLEKYKISQRGLFNLQLTPYSIKINSEVLEILKNNKGKNFTYKFQPMIFFFFFITFAIIISNFKKC